jgi:hypothetical protein
VIKAVLGRLTELGKIEPVNIEDFADILLYFRFSAASLTMTPLHLGVAKWKEGLEYLYSLNIKPIVA